MVKGELRPERCLRALMMSVMPVVLAACMHIGNERPVGMTLLFMNVGRNDIVVTRFDPDGLRGAVPGALGSGGGGAQMTFMPGDSKRGVPKFVEVEWVEPNNEFEAWTTEIAKQPASVQYSKENRETYKRLWNANPIYTRRIDLTPIITPELLTKVRADHQNTQLKLTVTFKNDDVSIQAEACKWRNR